MGTEKVPDNSVIFNRATCPVIAILKISPETSVIFNQEQDLELTIFYIIYSANILHSSVIAGSYKGLVLRRSIKLSHAPLNVTDLNIAGQVTRVMNKATYKLR
jgi:hypothetical protein